MVAIKSIVRRFGVLVSARTSTILTIFIVLLLSELT